MQEPDVPTLGYNVYVLRHDVQITTPSDNLQEAHLGKAGQVTQVFNPLLY